MSVDDVTVSAGSTATLTCTATLPQYSHYQDDSTVDVQLTGPAGTLSPSSTPSVNGGVVSAVFIIPSLSVSSTGVYTCSVSVSSSTQFVINSSSNTDTATVKLMS